MECDGCYAAPPHANVRLTITSIKMNETYNPKETNYPGWPNSKTWQPLDQWKKDIEPTAVPASTGILYSDIGWPKEPCSPPHPEFVKEWRSRNNETVKSAAKYFGLSEVQVLEACR